MPFVEKEIKVKNKEEKGSIFNDDYKAYFTDVTTRNKYGNSHLNGHLNSSIAITPQVLN